MVLREGIPEDTKLAYMKEKELTSKKAARSATEGVGRDTIAIIETMEQALILLTILLVMRFKKS
jgi:hypothetical protein